MLNSHHLLSMYVVYNFYLFGCLSVYPSMMYCFPSCQPSHSERTRSWLSPGLRVVRSLGSKLGVEDNPTIGLSSLVASSNSKTGDTQESVPSNISHHSCCVFSRNRFLNIPINSTQFVSSGQSLSPRSGNSSTLNPSPSTKSL